MVNLKDVQGTLETIGKKVSNSVELTKAQESSFRDEGFALPANYSADGTGLPYSKVPSNRKGTLRRNIITWFVPEFGTVKMFINPDNISYNYKKLISKDKTKGGHTLQYWGEELTTLSITGTTGSSGVEGINVLYEIYRAEQYAFDPIALTIASNNYAQNAAADLVNSGLSYLGGALGSTIGGVTGVATNALVTSGVGGLLGLQSSGANMASNNFMSLAELAFGVEMYYNGWVFRGFFDSITVTEKDLLFNYVINFTVTQKRGYRENYLPWQKSPNNGPSQYGTPYSFKNE